jgi:hypothetical protein
MLSCRYVNGVNFQLSAFSPKGDGLKAVGVQAQFGKKV